jgi:hypothetical protein
MVMLDSEFVTQQLDNLEYTAISKDVLDENSGKIGHDFHFFKDTREFGSKNRRNITNLDCLDYFEGQITYMSLEKTVENFKIDNWLIKNISQIWSKLDYSFASYVLTEQQMNLDEEEWYPQHNPGEILAVVKWADTWFGEMSNTVEIAETTQNFMMIVTEACKSQKSMMKILELWLKVANLIKLKLGKMVINNDLDNLQDECLNFLSDELDIDASRGS